MTWQPIETAPHAPIGVLLWVPLERERTCRPGQDYSIQVGFFDGDHFCEQGTGHDLRERTEAWGGEGDYPTHWTPLPEAPQ